MHTRVHKFQPDKEGLYKCPTSACRSSFRYESDLKRHMRMHNNDFEQCQYCPFKYIFPLDHQKHLKRHFGIKDFECDQCGRLFRSSGQLNSHYEKHEGIIYCCLLCDGYEASNKSTIRFHLHRNHSGIVGSVGNWDHIQKFVKIK